jgi:predicted phage tail protein
MIDFAEAGGDIDVQFGDTFVESEEELLYSIGADTVVITPLPAGAKSGGAKLLLAGLIVASFFIPGSGILLATQGAFLGTTVGGTAAAGLAFGGTLNFAGLALALTATSLAMQGISQMMAPDPSVDSEIAANDEYLFDGSQSTIAQNNVVPVLLGEMIVGGVMISSTTIAGDYYIPSASSSTFSAGVLGEIYFAITSRSYGEGSLVGQIDTFERGRG